MSETFAEFTSRVPDFYDLNPTHKICHSIWYLHTVRGAEHISSGMINSLFSEIHSVAPPSAVYLPRMAARKPPLVIKSKQGYRLEARPRRELQARFGQNVKTVAISTLLSSLLLKIGEGEEADFLEETLRCYSVKAFRSAIVMVWILSYYHIMQWVLADQARQGVLNGSIQIKYPKKSTLISSIDSFSEFKEHEVIESLLHAKLISKNLCDVLKDHLKRRNAAAHPSSVVMTQAQADHMITDLVNNVILKLAN